MSSSPAADPGMGPRAARTEVDARLDTMMVERAITILPWLAGANFVYAALVMTGMLAAADGSAAAQAAAAGLADTAMLGIREALRTRRWLRPNGARGHGPATIGVANAGTPPLRPEIS